MAGGGEGSWEVVVGINPVSYLISGPNWGEVWGLGWDGRGAPFLNCDTYISWISSK